MGCDYDDGKSYGAAPIRYRNQNIFDLEVTSLVLDYGVDSPSFYGLLSDFNRYQIGKLIERGRLLSDLEGAWDIDKTSC